MKNFSKTLISMAAVMAVGSAMAVSAFAAMRADYDNGTLTVTGASTHGAIQTIMLVAGADKTKTAEQDEYVATGGEGGTIMHINQDDVSGAKFDGDINVQALADGNYKLMVSGSDGDVEWVTFTVGNTDPEPVPYLIGNVDGNTRINGTDAICVLRYSTTKKQDKNSTSTTYTGNVGDSRTVSADGSNLLIGNVDGNTRINGTDAICILRYSTTKKQDKNSTSTTYTGNVGNTVYVKPQ